ncbi:beta-glucuronidase-like isoform X2 [Anthonomus grandis grandis]|uniref:beta-glucuronidase-like isoform X2 n=1 Tax=Anthonomus grandis grandis TaxID=2921223 RepID=UPI0021660C1A|nr:beta-glucuronidase-like isoform X2 [Anthonomus grandis grandis]
MKGSEGIILISCFLAGFAYGGVLQVKPSKTREIISLDGLWHFTMNASLVSNIEEADDLEVNLMPVPSSYNDISTKLNVRDHVGAVWYKRTFFVPSSWKNKKVWIRFGSVCYNASVEINDNIAVTHYIGHLPFASEISSYLNFGDENTIIVEVNNILTNISIPQGSVETLSSGRLKQTYTFDFFNYAGIDRPVYLYTTSDAFVDDIDIKTQVNGTTGLVSYDVAISGSTANTNIQVNILDKKGQIVGSSQQSSDLVIIENANLWWPYLMHDEPGYLYNLEILIKENDVLIDHYKQPFGIRELKYDNTSFTINRKNIYIRGFGRHEDSDIRGKGLDLPLIIRDHNLIKWIGANCYRTSHYPYADEIMDLADQLGIMIIDEVPAVNTENFSDELLENHKRSWTELYKRDKNRPSVVIWSIANEPRTQLNASEDYYRQVAAHVKSIDTSRPITIAESEAYNDDLSGRFLDILGVNRYEGWYLNAGDTDLIYENILEQARGWYQKHQKPVLFTEYGADSQGGLSFLPTYIWSEEYQLKLMEEYFKAFDELRSEGWFIGEMIWNFAEFKTDQSIKRMGGNKKGLFTRDRQPKQAAFLMRKRYWALANLLDHASLPADLEPYVIDSFSNNKKSNDEL